MPSKDFCASTERRAYFRLLRYLLSEEVHASYGKDESHSLPSRIEDLLRDLEQREASEKH